MSFKTILVFAVLLLAVSGPILARSYALDGNVDDVTDKPETTTTTSNTTSTTSTTTQQSTILQADDSSPPNNTFTISSSEEDDGGEDEDEEEEEDESDEAEDRSDSGEPPDDPIDRSDTELEHSWTPVALVKGVSSKTPFQVYKQEENGEKPKRAGFRNVRTHRGSKRYSNSVTTQRPPPSPPRLISMTFPETDMSSYMIQNASPEDSVMVGSENLAVTVVPPPVIPPRVREEPVEDAYASAVGGVPPALAAVTAAGVPGVVEDAYLDQIPSQANHGPRNQQALFRPSEEWRNNYQYQTHQHSGRQNNDKVMSANGEVIQLIPFTLEDTIPRTTPTYFPHPSFNEQLKKEEQNQRPEKPKENVYVNYHITNPTPTKPTVDLTRTKPRPFPSVSVKQRPAQRNVTSSRTNNHKEEKRNRRPSFVSKFNTELSQDTGISTTRSPNKPDYSNHPNGAFSRQVFNVGNKTVVDVTPTPGGKKEVSFPLNVTNQERFNSSRNLKVSPTQSTSLGHRPVYGGFDRYRVPAGRPKIGYNVRVRPPGSNALHPHLHLHHHPHDNHGSASINVGRVVLPPNAVVQTRPKPPPGFVHRHPALVSIAHANPTPGVPSLQNPSGNGSAAPGISVPSRYPQPTNYPKTEYRPGGLPHPALISEVKRPYNAHEHYPVMTIQKYRYPPPPPGYVKGRQPGLRPQVHPNDETLPPSSQSIRRPFHDDQRVSQLDNPGRYGNGAVKQGPVRQGGPSGSVGLGGPGISNGFGPGGPGTGSGPSDNGGQNQHKYGEGYDGNRGPISTSLRNPYAEVPQGTRDDSFSSASVNSGRYTPTADSYNPNNPQPHDNDPGHHRQQSQNPSLYPFPSNPADQNKSKPNTYRDEYDEYYSPQQKRVRPTTIRPAIYKDSNSGFSVSEITHPDDSRRPNDTPKHYGFPKLPSSTIRPPQEDTQAATSSQSIQIGGNLYKDRNQGYSVYEEENYPTPRSQPPKYTQASSSTQGKTSYVSSSTLRPRYKPRRPALKTTTDSQSAAGSLSASYTAPPSFGSEVGGGEDGDMTFTYAKTDYNGNVKWGVRHQVGTGAREGEYGQ